MSGHQLLTVDALNSLGHEEFTEKLGNVIEHCPIVAAAVWKYRPFRDINHLHDDICRVLDELPIAAREGVLRLHPDLAGRLADEGALTMESSTEQKAAGLDTMMSEEKTILKEANDRYKTNFLFPFVICARRNKKEAILRGIQDRLQNSAEAELRNGIEEVKKICYLRLLNIVEHQNVESKL